MINDEFVRTVPCHRCRSGIGGPCKNLSTNRPRLNRDGTDNFHLPRLKTAEKIAELQKTLTYNKHGEPFVKTFSKWHAGPGSPVWLLFVPDCPFCGKLHSHGGGGDPSFESMLTFMGDRVSHCYNGGYELSYAGEWTK